MSRFYPPSVGGHIPYDLYVVSGIVKNGILVVSWSTGKPATQQIDYGIDDDTVPQQTAIPLDNNGQRIYSIMHEVNFPQTFVDTRHYFRVRSVNRKGRELVSPVYSVYVTGTVALSSYMAAIEVETEQITVTPKTTTLQLKEATSLNASAEPKGQTQDFTIASDKETLAVADADAEGATNTSFETNITTTVN